MVPHPAANHTDALGYVFSFLSEDDRKAAAAVSRGWQATMRADPQLWPTVVLRAPCLKLKDFGYDIRADRPWVIPTLIDWENEARAELLSSAARLSRRTLRVRLEEFDDQPDLIIGVLAVLPIDLHSLELVARCTGPVLGVAGQRFHRLRQCSIVGNSANIDWQADGTAAIVPLLEELEMEYSMPSYDESERMHCPVPLPNHVSALLRGASRLCSLTLGCQYSAEAGALICALPALRDLRLTILAVGPELEGTPRGLAAAVMALEAATQLTGLHLYVTTSTYGEGDVDDDDDANQHNYGEDIGVPPLGGLTHLTSLAIAGLAALPPDWRQLSGLRSLSVSPLLPEEPQPDAHDFHQPVTALVALSRLCLRAIRLTPALCGLTALRHLEVSGGTAPMPEEMSQLTALTHLKVWHHIDSYYTVVALPVPPPVPPPVQHLPSLRTVCVNCTRATQASWLEALRALRPDVDIEF